MLPVPLPLPLLAALCAAPLGAAPEDPPAPAVELPPAAPSAEDVRPLLPGAAVPSVEVSRGDGEVLDLAEAAVESPTIFVFYRGGW